MARQSARMFPGMDVEAVAHALRERLAASRQDPGKLPDDPLGAAIDQMTGGSVWVGDRVVAGKDHVQPCRSRECRPCGYARAILVLLQHQAHSGAVEPTRPDALLQRGDDLRDLVESAQSIRRDLEAFEAKLSEHVTRWAKMHEKLLPLGERGHDHDAMCARPAAALETVRGLREQLPPLAEGLLAPLRPELRAVGQKPPDTLFVDFVRELAFVGIPKEEIADLIVRACGTESGDRDYWIDKTSRALRRMDTPDAV